MTPSSETHDLDGSFGHPIRPTSGDSFSRNQLTYLEGLHLVNRFTDSDGRCVGEVLQRPTPAELEAHDLTLCAGSLRAAFEKPNGHAFEIYEQKVVDSGVEFLTPPDRALKFARRQVREGNWRIDDSRSPMDRGELLDT
jgi:hypothetical protein